MAIRFDYVRHVARERDNNTCQSCGRKWVEGTRIFPVHHLNGLCGKIEYGEDIIEHLDILITLCTQCHSLHPQHRKVAEGHLAIDKYGKQIREMLAEGLSKYKMAERLGVTRAIIYKVINKMQ